MGQGGAVGSYDSVAAQRARKKTETKDGRGSRRATTRRKGESTRSWKNPADCRSLQAPLVCSPRFSWGRAETKKKRKKWKSMDVGRDRRRCRTSTLAINIYLVCGTRGTLVFMAPRFIGFFVIPNETFNHPTREKVHEEAPSSIVVK